MFVFFDCVYFKEDKCTGLRSVYYDLRCVGSAHCKRYTKISEEEHNRKLINKKSTSKKDDGHI